MILINTRSVRGYIFRCPDKTQPDLGSIIAGKAKQFCQIGAYKLKVELTVKGDDEREEVRFNIYSVKLSGRKWVLYADDKTMGKLTGRFGKVYAEIKEDADEVVSDHKESLDALSGEVKAQDD